MRKTGLKNSAHQVVASGAPSAGAAKRSGDGEGLPQEPPAERLEVPTAFFIAMLLLLLAILVPFWGLALHAHALADDYSMAERAVNHGFWQAQVLWYQEWSGRFAGNANLTLFFLVTPMSSYAAGCFGVFAAVFLGMYWVMHRLLSRRLGPMAVLLTALSLYVLYLVNLPSLNEGFYWVCGAIGYELANSFALLLLGILIALPESPLKSRRIVLHAACALLAILSAGSNETLMLVLLAFLTAGIAFKVIGHSRKGLEFWIVSLAAGVVAAAVVVASPGNRLRMAYYPMSQQFFASVSNTIELCWKLLGTWMINWPMALGSLAWLAVLWKAPGPRGPKVGPVRVGLVLVVGLGLLFLSVFPAYWSMGIQPPVRTLNTCHLVAMIGWFTLLTVAAAAWPVRPPSSAGGRILGVAAMVLALLAANSFRGTENVTTAFSDLEWKACQFHLEMKNREMLIAQAQARGVRRLDLPVILTRPKHLFFSDLSGDPNYWANDRFAKYYGFEAVRGFIPQGYR